MPQPKKHDDYDAVFDPPKDLGAAAYERECAEQEAINTAAKIIQAQRIGDYEALEELRTTAADKTHRGGQPTTPLPALKLDSDFRDTYDIMFDRSGSTFRRRTTDGPDRIRMFQLFAQHGLRTPDYGTVSQLKHQLVPPSHVVVHLNLDAHRGEGKALMTLADAYYRYADAFAVRYVDPGTEPAVSYRLLLVGLEWFVLRYVSFKDWRSNFGDGEVTLLKRERIPADMWPALLLRQELKAPLFAVDFVEEGGSHLALDINVAPQLRGTGVERVLTPTDVVTRIKQWMQFYG